MSKVVHAVRWNLFGSVARTVILIVQLVVLARILDQKEYGLAAIVLTIVNFARIVSDFGISSAVIQSPIDLTNNQRSSLFWFNIFIYGLVSLIIFLAAGPIADFMRNGELRSLLRTCSLVFLFLGLGVQFLAEAQRRLDFGPVSVIESVTLLIGLIVTLGSAFSGVGAMSVVLGGIASSMCMSTLLWLWPGKRWIPSLHFRYSEIAGFLKFGSVLFLSNVFNQLAGVADMFIAPRYLPATTVGAYALPRQMILQLQQVINPVITRVALPVFAKSIGDIDRVRNQFRRMLQQVSYVNAPLYAGIFGFAPEIIRIAAGAGWEDSAIALQILAVRGMFRTLTQPAGSLILGLGRTRLSLYWNLATFVLIVISTFACIPFGLAGVSIGVTLSSVVLLLPCWLFLVRPLCAISLIEFLDASFRSSLVAIPAVYVAYLASRGWDSTVVRVAIGGTIASLLYILGSWFANNRPQEKIFDVLGLKRALNPARTWTHKSR